MSVTVLPLKRSVDVVKFGEEGVGQGREEGDQPDQEDDLRAGER